MTASWNFYFCDKSNNNRGDTKLFNDGYQLK